MDFLKYMFGGFLWAVSFYVGFNMPFWMGINSIRIGIIGG